MGRVWPRHGHRGRPLNSVVSPMLVAAFIFFAVLALGTGFALFIAIGSAQAEIARVSPAYASRLFSAGPEYIFTRIRLRLGVLLKEPIPGPVVSWVFPIKVLATVYVALLFLTTACIVAGLVFPGVMK